MSIDAEMERAADLLEKCAEVIDAQAALLAQYRTGQLSPVSPDKIAGHLHSVHDLPPDEASKVATAMAQMAPDAREALIELLDKTAAYAPDHALGGPVAPKQAEASTHGPRSEQPAHHRALDEYFNRLYAETGGNY